MRDLAGERLASHMGPGAVGAKQRVVCGAFGYVAHQEPSQAAVGGNMLTKMYNLLFGT